MERESGYIDYKGSWADLINIITIAKKLSTEINIDKLLDRMDEIIEDNRHYM